MSHTRREELPWEINVPDHPERTNSPGYRRSRKLMIRIVQTTQPWPLGDQPYQDHHGGGIWVKDAQGWLLVMGLAGMEWSAQFCADPAKVDILRQTAARVVAGFPETLPGYVELGYHDAADLLATPITSPETVASWADGIFNASIPLPATMHTGVRPKGAGYHHYPKPIVDILTFKRDDFDLFVDDEEGRTVAVTPMAPRFSGDGRVAVAWAPPDSPLAPRLAEAERAGQRLVLADTHPLAHRAFARQT